MTADNCCQPAKADLLSIEEALESGTAARIFTGAALPEGADAVVVQKVCTREGDWVEIGTVFAFLPFAGLLG